MNLDNFSQFWYKALKKIIFKDVYEKIEKSIHEKFEQNYKENTTKIENSFKQFLDENNEQNKDFDKKILEQNELQFKPELKVDNGIVELRGLLTQGRIKNSFLSRFSNFLYLRPMLSDYSNPLGEVIKHNI